LSLMSGNFPAFSRSSEAAPAPQVREGAPQNLLVKAASMGYLLFREGNSFIMSDNLVGALLHHRVDQVLLVALQDDTEQKKRSRLLRRYTLTSLAQDRHLVSYKEVTTSVHDNFCEDGGCSLFLK